MPGRSSSATPNRKRRLPWWAGFALIGAVIYDISPIDLIPEGFFGPFGFADDALLTIVVLTWLGRSYLASSKKDVARSS